MGEQETRAAVDKMQQALATKDFRAALDLYEEDAVQEWPQSGERIRGKKNIAAIDENYPGLPEMELRRVLVSGDVAIAELKLNYGGKPVHGVTIYELRNGKILRETGYFADPFEAPEWRKQWVEKMEPAGAAT